ncbi:MAG TPA: V-type ATP synthase subunit B, partial [Candidatus Syntrophosphaera thermopropionivorans]|nr:V-type ATP synthase subunit B [Candidatus Syntrophosphaera thermopropionivorans]
DPARSLSRLRNKVIGKRTRADHPQVMSASVRLNADAMNARTKLENGFDLTDYDQRALQFARDYAEQILAIDVNIDTEEMLDKTWALFRKYFTPEEVGIKDEFMKLYWNKE